MGPPWSGRGVELSQDYLTRHGEGGGFESSQDDSTPNGRGGGVKSWQDDLTPNGMGRVVKSSQDDSTPREAEGPRGDKTWDPSQRPATHVGRTDGGREGGTKTHPPPEKPWSKGQMVVTAQRGAARRDATERRRRKRR